MAPQWAWWHLKSPASLLFTERFIQAQIKENIKAWHHWPLCGNSLLTGEFPIQKASNAENVSIRWRHHVEPARYDHVSVNCIITDLCDCLSPFLCKPLEIQRYQIYDMKWQDWASLINVDQCAPQFCSFMNETFVINARDAKEGIEADSREQFQIKMLSYQYRIPII